MWLVPRVAAACIAPRTAVHDPTANHAAAAALVAALDATTGAIVRRQLDVVGLWRRDVHVRVVGPE